MILKGDSQEKIRDLVQTEHDANHLQFQAAEGFWEQSGYKEKHRKCGTKATKDGMGGGALGGIRPVISMLLAAVITYLVYEWEQLEQGLLMNKESREKNDML